MQLPLGSRYLPIIYGSFACYLGATILKALTVRSAPARDSPQAIILLGTFEAKHRIASLLVLLTNTLFLIAAVDFVFRPHFLGLGEDIAFSRVGYTSASTAQIVLRAPFAGSVQLEYRVDQSSEWTPGPIQDVFAENDFVTTFAVDTLYPDTTYWYRTNASQTGSFRTKSSDPKRWSMISTSCLKPGYPYRPWDDQLRIVGLEHLSNYIEGRPMEFMLFLGDFIYIDLPRRFGFQNKDYREAYQQVYASPSWTPALRDLSFLHTYDDHEFSNDWAANTTGLFNDAVEPFLNYQGNGNPNPPPAGESWYKFKQGDVEFFVADARKYRSSNDIPDGPEKTMLGEAQLHALEEWLENSMGWKVFVSSVPFTRNWRGPEAYDSWAGYLWERQRILERMWKTNGTIVISGDRHEHSTTEFPSPNGNSTVIEFSTSPLSQFYQPFERTYQEIEESDIQVHYHPWGNSKFGIFTFDTAQKEKRDWTMTFELVVDGVKTWEKTVTCS